MLRKFMFLFFSLLSLFACATVFETPPGLQAIEETQSDCKIKAIRGNDWCRDHGIESRIICGFISGGYEPEGHCWLEIYHVDGWKLVDLNEWTVDGWPVEQYSSEYLPYIRFSGNVKMIDILEGKNYDWIRDSSLQELKDSCELSRKPSKSEMIMGH